MSLPPLRAASPNASPPPFASASSPSCSPGGGASSCAGCSGGCSGSGILSSSFTSGSGGFCSGGGGGGGGGGLSKEIWTTCRFDGLPSFIRDSAPHASIPANASRPRPMPMRVGQLTFLPREDAFCSLSQDPLIALLLHYALRHEAELRDVEPAQEVENRDDLSVLHARIAFDDDRQRRVRSLQTAQSLLELIHRDRVCVEEDLAVVAN